MAQPTVKTVQFIDPRIEPQPDPVYDYVIAPTQNQFYRINSSGLSDSSITFNNLTTLGIDRAYLDTFEIELTADFTFTNAGNGDATAPMPGPAEWTFDSFPFNKCCEEIHVNINGGAFFSQPLSYLRAKERYMDQAALARCYENVCPVQKPYLQYESGHDYTSVISASDRRQLFNETQFTAVQVPKEGAGTNPTVLNGVKTGRALPTRYGYGIKNWQQGPEGMFGGFNNSIIKLGPSLGATGYTNYSHTTQSGETNNKITRVRVTWREPIFCSPFSSRYDATYGRPLYNITSMDITFTMQNLGNMIRVMNVTSKADCVADYSVNIVSAFLCYQVMTIPPVLTKPLTTLVPYRRFVPYITDYSSALTGANDVDCEFNSGVYTFNEIPTAIWLFVGPSKKFLQTNTEDRFNVADADQDAVNVASKGNWDCNKLFAFIKHVNITMANTTQILDTARIEDLYRIAKANGCEDSFLSWSGIDVLAPNGPTNLILGSAGNAAAATGAQKTTWTDMKQIYRGAGSVLRLKPGVDLTIPDQALIPGANANNMVFKATVNATVPRHAAGTDQYSLWLLFEYVGVAAISPGQCEITMNPLGSGEIMASSPVVSATSEATEGKLEGGGNGIWDRLIRALRIANQVAKDTGIVSRILKLLPRESAKGVASFLDKNGYGDSMMDGAGRASKRSRGGAVIGRGLQDWSV